MAGRELSEGEPRMLAKALRTHSAQLPRPTKVRAEAQILP